MERSVPRGLRATHEYSPWSLCATLGRGSWGLKLSGMLPLSWSLNQAKLSTGGAALLLQVRVTDSPSDTGPPGLTTTYVERGASVRGGERRRELGKGKGKKRGRMKN